MKSTFTIVGGGIGGLTLAIALQKNGQKAVVYEQAPVIKPIGAGIVLAGNAIKAFDSIGLAESVLYAGKLMKQFVIKDQKGKSLSTTMASDVRLKYGLHNTVTLHRADLHSLLISQLQPGTIILNKAAVDFTQSEDNARVNFRDGSSVVSDCVIAADGINSIFRKRLIPSSVERYSGYTCWRGVTNSIPAGVNDEIASESWGKGLRFGIVPLNKNRVYWFATADAQARDQRLASFSIPDLAKLYRGFHNPVQELIEGTQPEHLLHHDISDLKPIKNFYEGRVVLIGDAAHATTPNLGQGACMAIEDAVVLSNCFSQCESIAVALLHYQQKRIARTTRIVNDSFNLGKVAQVKNPILAALRDTMMRLTPPSIAQRQMRFLYDISFT